MMRIPRKLLIRLLLLSTVIFTIILSSGSFLNSHSIHEYKLRMKNTIRLKYSKWTKHIFSSSHDFFLSNKNFMLEIEAIRAKKLAHDKTNNLWQINEKVLGDMILSVHIPDYFLVNTNKEKPLIQAYDPRFTLSLYLNKIATSPNDPVEFNWADWVDMSILNQFVFAPQDQKSNCKDLFSLNPESKFVEGSELASLDDYCVDDKDSALGFRIIGPTGDQSIGNRRILGKAYLFSAAPSPSKLVFMTTDSGSYEVPVKDRHDNNVKHGLLRNNMVEDYVKQHNTDKLDLARSFNRALKSNPPKNQHEDLSTYELTIDEKDFHPAVGEIIKSLESRSDISSIQKDYLDALKYSESLTDPPKFFAEAKLLNGMSNKGQGDHYDWRFFSGILVGKEVQVVVLHRMIKNYLAFTKQHGIITWIAHGSLLAWYWNGMAFPWDTDIDVQMPIQQLYRFAERFNQSLVIESVTDKHGSFSGTGRYFIDIGSSVTHRTRGNGNNNIDARFIDVDTGLYIDITGLALTDAEPPSRYDYIIELDKEKQKQVYDESGASNYTIKNQLLQAYNCRNHHFNLYSELSPLVLTLVENQPGYIPRNFYLTLSYEYGLRGLEEEKFENHIYMSNLRLWVPKDTIVRYIDNPEKFLQESNHETVSDLRPSAATSVLVEMSNIDKLGRQDHLNLLHDDNLFKSFMFTSEFTEIHELEVDALLDEDFSRSEGLVSHYKGHGDALRVDYFTFMYFQERWNNEQEVANFTRHD
ncbi:Piso0_000339 [Millerozyma farinosa CBS 7064]|uniref:Piso0_000339 protein n=1 Tax=Pichia sorbitophila (strain ATCC MYA-4447 / BCRC 22081 / CBS 7064 / NBRC 10061 / NRRL Y-12695) TaxID=559304 RepID=G8YV62_PICSO|nr:Piso0_000339 [Millerozyma farinosa CBS 7064]CCE73306.1 Piso0_000339 [Millerozyma farinosa CBS 7064]